MHAHRAGRALRHEAVVRAEELSGEQPARAQRPHDPRPERGEVRARDERQRESRVHEVERASGRVPVSEVLVHAAQRARALVGAHGRLGCGARCIDHVGVRIDGLHGPAATQQLGHFFSRSASKIDRRARWIAERQRAKQRVAHRQRAIAVEVAVQSLAREPWDFRSRLNHSMHPYANSPTRMYAVCSAPHSSCSVQSAVTLLRPCSSSPICHPLTFNVNLPPCALSLRRCA